MNGLQPLQSGLTYNAEPDTFACNNTVLPENGTCNDYTKAMYRVFNITDTGYVQLKGLKTIPGESFRYKLFQGRLDSLAIEQNAYSDTSLIADAIDVLEGNCIMSSGVGRNYYCLSPSEYTLVTYGGINQLGKADAPAVYFKKVQTKYHSRELAEDLGDLVPPPQNVEILDCFGQPTGFVFISPSKTYTSNKDTFSCMSNPDTIGGLAPCGSYPNNAKLIYRQFYLSEPRIVRIYRQGDLAPMNLFKGKATDLNDTLVPWIGKNNSGADWASCFYDQTTSPCDPLPPGWYTVVSYGYGASYDKPFLNNADGFRHNLGGINYITIESNPLSDEPYDTPTEAYQINSCNPVDWNISAASNDYPNTSLQYNLKNLQFGCISDLPWSDHPIFPCKSDDEHVIYSVFEVTQPSFLRILGVPDNLTSAIYPGNCIDNPQILVDSLPIYPCSDPSYPELQICNLQPGYYTFVVFSGPGDPKSFKPTFIVERVGYSRFDHAVNAYDFGLIPPDGVQIWGKPGDVHPFNPNLKPSNDFIYCTTGAQPSDPIQDLCVLSNGNKNLIYNPLIYSGTVNIPLYLDTLPSPASGQRKSLRNLWYTFALAGSGKVEVEIDKVSSSKMPRVEIYKSDVDGSIPFEELVAYGGIDSTLADGLTFVASNRNGSTNCRQRDGMISFEKTQCDSDTTRYYVIVTMWDWGNYSSNQIEPNQQVELGIKYEGVIHQPVKYDHFQEANVINGLNEDKPPYTAIALGEGIYFGAPASLECATRDAEDPYNNMCYLRSVWYKFTVTGTGTIRLAHEIPGLPNSQGASSSMKLYRELVPGDIKSLVEVKLVDFPADHPNNNTGYKWREGCYEAGTYYILWIDCDPASFSIVKTYRPIVWLLENLGDFCHTAINVNVDGPGIFVGKTRVDCHTIGTDFGENGSNMGCLSGPSGYKSTWFKFSLLGTTKHDIQFNFDASQLIDPAGPPIDPSQVRARILYGSCDAMTAGSCLASSTASIKLYCLGPGDYFVQLTMPMSAKGEISVTLTVDSSLDQTCNPLDPTHPFANFSAMPSCDSDSIEILNFSTAGSAVQYLWNFPGGYTSNAFVPQWSYPKSTQPQIIEITLKVLNTNNGLIDSVTQQILIPPKSNAFPTDTIEICNCADTLLIAPITGVNLSWQNGSTNPVLQVNEPGVYWVDMKFGNCLIRDTTVVEGVSCEIIETYFVTLCKGEPYNGIYYQNDTVVTSTYLDGCQNIVEEKFIIDLLDTALVLLPDITLCEGDTIDFAGLKIWQPGIYEAILSNSVGCDSTVVLPVTVKPPALTVDTLRLCEGELFLGNIGTDTLVCESFTDSDGCDSTHCTYVVFLDTFSIVQQASICEGEVLDFNGEPLSTPGYYCKTFSSINGCDSTVCIELMVLESSIATISPEICAGECYIVGDSCFSNTGLHVAVLQAANGCDSIVFVSLKVHPLPAVSISGNKLFCDGDSILLDAGNNFSSYSWSSGESTQSIWVKTSNSYSVTVEDEFGCKNSDIVDVNAIQVLADIEVLSSYNGASISCHGASDASIRAVATGGVGSYVYFWQNAAQTQILSGIPSGHYFVTITDGIGCQDSASIEIKDPEAIELIVDSQQPTCYGDEDGRLQILANGGTPPYRYSIDGLNWNTQPVFVNLPAGEYLVKIADGNGCQIETLVILEPPTEWFLEVIPDSAAIRLGESVEVTYITNMDAPAIIRWMPEDGLSCLEGCKYFIASPTSSTDYVLTLIDSLGCAVSDEFHIKVDKRRNELYAPNVFSPNADGINDYYTIFGGPSASKLNVLRIYDRWGGLAFQTFNIPLNEPELGWDGYINGIAAQAGEYVFMAEVEFKDGSKKIIKGGFVLIR